jgi:hypothetical protein
LYCCIWSICLFGPTDIAAQTTPTSLLLKSYTPSRTKGTILFFLQDIQEKTGIPITYSSTYLPLNNNIVLTGVEHTVGDVLATVLRETGIGMTEMNGKLLLLKNMAPVTYHTISGFVKEANSNEAIIGASVYDPVSRKGTASNAYGFYSLLIPDTCRQLVYSHIGYEAITRPITANTQDEDVFLLARNQLQTVVVRGDGDSVIIQPGHLSMPVSYLENFPALLGEKDVLKSLQLYPGTGSSLESSSNLLIRGGSADQNLYLLDGVPLYHTGHLFGLFSIFNGDALKDVQFYKDGFPARYGGRLSSVVDIRTKDGNMLEWHGKTTISPLAANILIEGPLKKEKSAVQLSVRRSLVDALYRGRELRKYGDYYLYDINFKLNQVINKKNRVYLSFYMGQDKLVVNSDNPVLPLFDNYSFAWSNITSSLKWATVFSPRLFSHTYLTYGRFFNKFYQTSVIPLPFNDSIFVTGKGISRIQDISIRNETEYAINNVHRLSFGAGYTYHNFAPTAYKTNVHTSEPIQRNAPKYYMSEFNAYIEDEMSLLDNKITVQAGAHIAGLAQQSALYPSFQPRLLFRWNMEKGQYLQASFSKMTQFIHLLTTPIINLPTDLWVPSTDNIRPEHAYSYSIAYQKQYYSQYSVGFNVYFKQMKDIVTTNTVLNIFDNSDLWEKKVIAGNGYNYGAEISTEKIKGRFTGIFSYTLSWAFRQFDKLNGGLIYPYKDDRRHNLSLALKYRVTRHWNISASWKYASGAPFTLPQQIYPDFDQARNISGYLDERYSPFRAYLPNYLQYITAINNFRLRPVHHLDIGTTVHLGNTKPYQHIISAGVYNVYNRRNPFIVSYDQFSLLNYTSEYALSLYQYSIFRALPYLSYTFKF